MKFPLSMFAALAMGALMLGGVPPAQATHEQETVQLVSTADTTVDSSQPTTNFGTKPWIAADGSPTVRAMMKFDLGAFAGRTVVSASLRLTNASASVSASVGMQTVHHMGSTTWSETGTTYTNAPAPGTSVGSFGPTVVDQVSNVPIPASAVQSAVGGLFGLAVSQTNSDGIYLQSREATTGKPTLTVTFAGPDDRLQAGACPANPAGPSASAQQTIVDKFGPAVTGKDVAVRQFSGGFSDVAPRVAGVSLVHFSWKPTSVAAITDTQVAALTVNLQAGDVVEVWHEVDKKVRDGVFTMSEGVARKNAFYDAVKRVRPDLRVANTLTGWEADPDNGTTHGNIDKWAAVKADVLGLDFDGANTWPYPDYQDEVPVAVDFVSRFEPYSEWAAPEYGAPYRPEDPNGTALEAWSDDNMALYREQGAAYVMWYDYHMANDYLLDSPTELRMWREQVAQN